MRKKFIIIMCIAILLIGAFFTFEFTKDNSKEDKTVDYDLSVMGKNMVYSEVYNIMNSPKTYVDKTIKIKGIMHHYNDTVRGKEYNSIIIKDAMGCCQQGIEFVLKGEKSYPDDYPKVGLTITIIGKFETYVEGSKTYCNLVDTEIIN